MTDHHVESLLASFPTVTTNTNTELQEGASFWTMSSRNACDEILHQLREAPVKSVSLIMLGPLTNLALAIERDDEDLSVLSRVKTVFVMGGAIHQPTPGTLPHALFDDNNVHSGAFQYNEFVILIAIN